MSRDEVARIIEIIKTQPTAPDTIVGTRQEWMRASILARIEGKEPPVFVAPPARKGEPAWLHRETESAVSISAPITASPPWVSPRHCGKLAQAQTAMAYCAMEKGHTEPCNWMPADMGQRCAACGHVSHVGLCGLDGDGTACGCIRISPPPEPTASPLSSGEMALGKVYEKLSNWPSLEIRSVQMRLISEALELIRIAQREQEEWLTKKEMWINLLRVDLDAARAELRTVDDVLSRRTALDDKANRVDKILHAINEAKKVDPFRAEVEKLTRERDAYKKAKQENDDRFMRERDEARAEAATLKAKVQELSFDDALNVAEARIKELETQLNTPEVLDFIKAVHLEAAHQRERWGTDHDQGKEDEDWFWLIGYLAGKALQSLRMDPGDQEKQLHRIVTIAAAAANWHLYKLGKTDMRPGTKAPPGEG